MHSLHWWFNRDSIPPMCILSPALEAFSMVQSDALLVLTDIWVTPPSMSSLPAPTM